MRVDEAKETVLISSFTQAKEENFRRSYEVDIVILWLIKGATPLSSLPYEAGDGHKRRCTRAARTIPDLIVRRGKKLL
jgi:hypothetical protein